MKLINLKPDDIIQQQPIAAQKNSDIVYTSQLIDVKEISKRVSAEIESGNIVGGI
ncbi:7306_t:CDS:2 [Cetraspora pellucida]|uniref:7306_t:CDS:1 n=1 Tax=Cetraspora pellucida TaxID=1433469 RepID=A0A9N8W1I6_9GLOM|nr:7306_t:CDS:2 [Cetraspora pellucida]